MNKATPKSSLSNNIHSNAGKDQRERLLTTLREAGSQGLSTIQLREQHDIIMPAARMHELLWDQGYNIQAIPTHDENAQGNSHLCTRYVLLSGVWKHEGSAA